MNGLLSYLITGREAGCVPGRHGQCHEDLRQAQGADIFSWPGEGALTAMVHQTA